MSLRVAPYEGTNDEWDSFARAQHGYTHFHRFEWKALITDVFGHSCTYLAARTASGTVEGILPLVRVKSLVFGHYLVSMPFLNYGGPLGTAEAVEILGEAATALARSTGA